MITQEELKEILDYNSETGVFVWKNAGFNKGYLNGKSTGNFRKSGYIDISIKRKYYLAHRLAWLYIYGYWPKELDHINRVKTDNRIENLREVTKHQNHANKKNNSNMVGTYFHKEFNKWIAQIQYQGKRIHLGSFLTQQDAYEAYLFNIDRIEKGLPVVKLNHRGKSLVQST